ncbi:MAG: hypothetical protein LBC61_00885 [Candidatus Peribacteria bacterium]|jgi:hypothetical protein|nr:hypothetical protein [Candidatus Peribacteria bacterium]
MKNIFKVFLSAVIAMSVFFGLTFSFSFAKDKLTYNKALSLAEQYIENSLEDEFWKDNNPVVSD